MSGIEEPHWLSRAGVGSQRSMSPVAQQRCSSSPVAYSCLPNTEQLQSSMCTEGREGTGGLAHEWRGGERGKGGRLRADKDSVSPSRWFWGHFTVYILHSPILIFLVDSNRPLKLCCGICAITWCPHGWIWHIWQMSWYCFTNFLLVVYFILLLILTIFYMVPVRFPPLNFKNKMLGICLTTRTLYLLSKVV